MGKLIELIGTSGVGKTTIAHALEKTGEFHLGLEQHGNRPFQSLFKSNPRYGLANQFDYLLYRAEQEKQLRQQPLPGILDGGLDQDFHGFTQLFYYRGMLSQPEFEICSRLYSFIRSQLPLPDLIIHLVASNAAIQNRLGSRARINIATAEDANLIDGYLKTWSSTIPRENYLQIDITNTSSSYNEILPYLSGEIRARLGLDFGKFEIDYIP